MAILKLQNGDTFTDFQQIQKLLVSTKLELSHWPIEKTPEVRELITPDTLDEAQKNKLLSLLDDRFYEQQEKYGYQARDLVVLHSKVPKLEDMLNVFDKVHTHDDDEVRYIVDGSGVFGVILPDQTQALLTVEAGEYIRVPKNTKHWFVLTPEKRIKAIRYFTNKDGWAANFTGDKVHVV
jgi:1,2-dihydroxy-3-keto-5-methylthiopentene dioxygenase